MQPRRAAETGAKMIESPKACLPRLVERTADCTSNDPSSKDQGGHERAEESLAGMTVSPFASEKSSKSDRVRVCSRRCELDAATS